MMPKIFSHPVIARVRTWCAKHIVFVVGALAVAAVCAPWFASSGYLFFTDFTAGPRPELRWNQNGLPFRLAVVTLTAVFGGAFAQKTLVAGVLFLAYWAGTRIARAFTDDNAILALAGLFFLCNPFVYDRLGFGQVYVIAGTALLGMGVAELLRHLLREGGARSIVMAGVWCGLAVLMLPHAAFFALLLGFVWFVAAILRAPRAALKLAGPMAAAAALVVVLNLNWLTSPFGPAARASVFSADASQLDVFRTSGSSGMEALRNVVMLSGFWGKDAMRYPDLTSFKDAWGRSFIVLAPLFAYGAYVGLKDARRRALTLGLLVAGVVAAALAVGIRLEPTRALTEWLVANVPMYAGLRETQKWVAVLLVVYSAILCLALESLLRNRIVAINRKVAVTFVGAAIIMQVPWLFGGLAGTVRPHPYPADWEQAEQRITADGCEGLVLWLPWHLYMDYRWTGTRSANPNDDYFTCPQFAGTNMEFGPIADDSGDPRSETVTDWIDAKGASDALTELDIRFVVLAKEADWGLYDWLDDHPELKLIQDSPTLRLYARQTK